MSRRLDDLQPIHTLQKVIQAEDYNRVRLALRRIANPLRIELTGMRCLDIILSNKHWLCVDPCVKDRPVMAWTEFETAGRVGLHLPVSCVLRLYHVHAGLVMGEVIDALARTLGDKLDAAYA